MPLLLISLDSLIQSCVLWIFKLTTSFSNELMINKISSMAFQLLILAIIWFLSKKWVLPEFEKVQTLSDVIDYLYTFYFSGLDIFGPDVQFYRHIDDRDGLFCFELDDPYEIADRRAKNAIKRALYKAEHNINGFTEADYVKSCEDIKQSSKERKEYIGNILNNKQLHDETMAEIRRRKEKNIGILRSYGVDI